MALEGGPEKLKKHDVVDEVKEDLNSVTSKENADAGTNDTMEAKTQILGKLTTILGETPSGDSETIKNLWAIFAKKGLEKSDAKDEFIKVLNAVGIEAKPDDHGWSDTLHVISRNVNGDEIKDTSININVILANGKGLNPNNEVHADIIKALWDQGLIVNRKIEE